MSSIEKLRAIVEEAARTREWGNTKKAFELTEKAAILAQALLDVREAALTATIEGCNEHFAANLLDLLDAKLKEIE